MPATCTVHPDLVIDAHGPLTIIAGPCVLESVELGVTIGTHVGRICQTLGLRYVFKASYDKANRTSITSPRGPGLETGLQWLQTVRQRLEQTLGHAVPVTTDIHDPGHAQPAAAVVDLLQIPAFLCRQTDLLVAAAGTGRAVSVKKGQFLAPAEMKNVVAKLREAGGRELLLIERGTFFGYHRLVNDFIGLGDLMEVGPPVCFDATHSTQLPGATTTSGGRPDRAPLLARAAVAAGVPAVFIECHPEPSSALSDGSNMLRLDQMEPLLRTLRDLRAVVAPETARAAVW